jgi:PAS domain S-box-containing protein
MGSPLAVLLLEDSLDDADLIQMQLQRTLNLDVFERVENGEDLIQRARARRWDVILCDWHLPGFSALEALTILQWIGSEAPVIVVSGAVGEETVVEALHAGARDFLLKDRLGRLGAAVKNACNDARQRADQRALKAKVDAQEARLRALLESGTVAIGLGDENGHFAWVSPAVSTIFEMPRALLLGQRLVDLCHSDDREVVREALRQLASTPSGTTKTFEHRVHRKTGDRWLEVSCTNHVADPNVRGTTFDFRDISKRKASEAALLRAEDQLRRLQNAEGREVLGSPSDVA